MWKFMQNMSPFESLIRVGFLTSLPKNRIGPYLRASNGDALPAIGEVTSSREGLRTKQEN
jgi:hypothetical protein